MRPLAGLGMLLGIALTQPAAAQSEPKLRVPVDCDLGETCYIQQYVDHDPSEKWLDYKCNGLAYDGHKGTDFAVATVADALKGVDVLAAASGRVLGLRNSMVDIWSGKVDPSTLAGKDCGNGVVLDHGDGWHSQYCHLMQGSILVKKGQQVPAGTALGKIGMSGRTQFPHMHFSLRKNGESIDPFAPQGTSCEGSSAPDLWIETPIYQAGGLLDMGFSTAVPDFAQIKAGTAQEKLTSDSPAIVAFFLAFGARKGDVFAFKIIGPDGGVLVETKNVIPRKLALLSRAVGKKRRKAQWPKGTYVAHASLIRGSRILSEETASFTLTE